MFRHLGRDLRVLDRERIDEGFARTGARRKPEEFEVCPTVSVVVDDDVERAADAMRPMLALYIGGMGAREVNFHFDVFCRMGYEAEVAKIQELYLDGHKGEAAAAVPTKLIEQLTLIGTKDKIRADLDAWRESIVTTVLVGGDEETLRTAAELVLG